MTAPKSIWTDSLLLKGPFLRISRYYIGAIAVEGIFCLRYKPTWCASRESCNHDTWRVSPPGTRDHLHVDMAFTEINPIVLSASGLVPASIYNKLRRLDFFGMSLTAYAVSGTTRNSTYRSPVLESGSLNTTSSI